MNGRTNNGTGTDADGNNNGQNMNERTCNGTDTDADGKTGITTGKT